MTGERKTRVGAADNVPPGASDLCMGTAGRNICCGTGVVNAEGGLKTVVPGITIVPDRAYPTVPIREQRISPTEQQHLANQHDTIVDSVS
jgi:hypothetical protein